MIINLGLYTGEKNKINKQVSLSYSKDGVLRESSDVMNPSIIIEESPDVICGFNYAYIPDFKRWYFVENVAAYRAGLTIISLSVDVLYTYKETIMNSPAIIARSSKPGDAVYSLPDSRYPVKQSESTHVITFDTLYSNASDPTKGQTMVLIMTGIDKPSGS